MLFYFNIMKKICTDINQSKKLIELGIDISTADMLWTYDFMVNDINGLNVISEQLKPEENDIPAWSLTTLFNMLPKSAHLERGSSSELCRVTLPVELKCSDWYLDPIDALFEITCSLLEEK